MEGKKKFVILKFFIWTVSLWQKMLKMLSNTLKKIFFNVYLFLRQRERQTEHEQGRKRERETQNLKQAPGSELSAEPNAGLELMRS